MSHLQLAIRILLFSLLLISPVAAQSAKPTAAPNPNQWALLIGVNDYPGDIQDLRYAREDARALKELLVSSAGYLEDHVQLLTDDGIGQARATKQNILAAIEQSLAPRVQANHQVLVFLAGHGVVRGQGPEAKSYFLPVDLNAQSPETLERSGLDLEELAKKLSTLKASQFTIFVDACREDPFPGRGLKGNTLTDVMTRGLRIVRVPNAQTPAQAQPEAPTSVIFYACRIGERAYENPQLQHGVFTHFIMQGLRELAARPDGRVEAGQLAGYLRDNVRKWREEAGQRGGLFGEQTPTMIASEVRGPVLIAYVTPIAGAASTAPLLSGVTLSTAPAGALISLDGQAAGSGPIFKELAPREYTVRAELTGFQPVETKIKLVAGYQQEITLTLPPLAINASYEKGVQFENQQLWPQAIAAYEQALRDDPQALAVYERLANVYLSNGRWRDAVTLLSTAIQKFPNNATLLAQRSRAYSTGAMSEEAVAVAATTAPASTPTTKALAAEPETKDSGKKSGKKSSKKDSSKDSSDEVISQKDSDKKADKKSGKKSGKKDAEQELAAAPPPSQPLADKPRVVSNTSIGNSNGASNANSDAALRDAELAVQLDAKLAAAQLALGFAYLLGGRDPAKAVAAFVLASTLAPSDAEAYYGVGYAYRLQQQYQQAMPQLKKAVELRPDFYDAQRELAYCYHARGETDLAIKQYQVASSRRSKMKNSGDLASNDLALASLYQRKGEEVGGTDGEEYKKAAKAYEKDAREHEPSLKGAAKALSIAGVSQLVEGKLSVDVLNLFGKSKSGSSTLSPSSSGISIDKGGVTVPVKVGGGKLPVKVPVKIPVNIPIFGGGSSKSSKSEKSSEKSVEKEKAPQKSKAAAKVSEKILFPSKEKAVEKQPSRTDKVSEKVKPVEKTTTPEKSKRPIIKLP